MAKIKTYRCLTCETEAVYSIHYKANKSVSCVNCESKALWLVCYGEKEKGDEKWE